MGYYPVNIELEGKRCVVVGGGRVALRKAEGLLECGAQVDAISPAFVPGFRGLARCTLFERIFQASDVDRAVLVVAATDDAAINRAVADACRERGVLCNVADCPPLCDFILPAVLRRGDLCVAISTSGASPALAARLRKEADALLPADYGAYVAFLRMAREQAKTRLADPARRRQVAAILASRESYERFKRLDEPGRAAWLKDVLSVE